jgi:hypothetical protein
MVSSHGAPNRKNGTKATLTMDPTVASARLLPTKSRLRKLAQPDQKVEREVAQDPVSRELRPVDQSSPVLRPDALGLPSSFIHLRNISEL